MKLENHHRYFTDAYLYEFGTKWNWKNEDGTQNHPALSTNDNIRMFYKGFILASKGTKFYRDALLKIERLEEELKIIKKELL